MCLLFRVSHVVSDVKSCDAEQFVLSAAYDRTQNRTSIELRTLYLLPLARVEGESLISPYPWVDVSEMEAERAFATAQVGLLAELAEKFPLNDTISVRYTFGEIMVAIVFWVDSSYAVSDGSSVEFSEGIERDLIGPYAAGRNLTAFLSSRTVVTNRWRNLCKDTSKFDVPENATLGFVYHPDRFEFECSIETRVPVEYYLYFVCAGSKILAGTAVEAADGRVSGRLVVRGTVACRVGVANCTVSSPYLWSEVMTVEIPPVAEKLSGTEVNTAVSVTVAILILGLVVFVYFRYRSAMGPVRDTIGLIWGRMGYGRPGERCVCINSAWTEE